MSAPTPDALRNLAARLAATSGAAFASWDSPAGQLPYPTYAPIEAEWRRALTELGAIHPSPAYDRILSGEVKPATIETIRTADRDELDGYATHIVRSERFCDGSIAGSHADGLLAALLLRYAELVGD